MRGLLDFPSRKFFSALATNVPCKAESFSQFRSYIIYASLKYRILFSLTIKTGVTNAPHRSTVKCQRVPLAILPTCLPSVNIYYYSTYTDLLLMKLIKIEEYIIIYY